MNIEATVTTEPVREWYEEKVFIYWFKPQDCAIVSTSHNLKADDWTLLATVTIPSKAASKALAKREEAVRAVIDAWEEGGSSIYDAGKDLWRADAELRRVMAEQDGGSK